MFLWLRCGDADNYHKLDSLDEVIERLEDLGVGEVTRFVKGPAYVGMETEQFSGMDGISLYWGWADAEMGRGLSGRERGKLERALAA